MNNDFYIDDYDDGYLYYDDDITANKEQFIKYIERVDGITREEAEEAFAEGVRNGYIRRLGGSRKKK